MIDSVSQGGLKLNGEELQFINHLFNYRDNYMRYETVEREGPALLHFLLMNAGLNWNIRYDWVSQH
jgi:hypothetical protein